MPHSRTDAVRSFARLDGRIDWKIAVVTIVGTLAIIVRRYATLTPWPGVNDLLLYVVLPIAIIVFVFRESPRDFGLTLGDWRAGTVLTLGSIVLIAPVLYIVVETGPAMQAYYGGQAESLPWAVVIHLLAWEFLFRGWWLFGYAHKFGPDAIWLQAMPFALAHLGKPGIETLSAVFGGFAFGWIAYRTRSFLYPFIIHCFVMTFTVLLAAGATR